MKAWPFMFAASRTLDYQFVALPEIIDLQSSGSLRDRLVMDEDDPGRLRTASLSSSRAQALSCVYRSGPILVGDQAQVDSAGRKLLFASGLVVEDLPETLDEPAQVIDANSQWFEKRLSAFLNSNENWKPIVTKSVRLQIDPPAPSSGSVRMHASPVAILSLISILLFVLCAGLYVKIRSLESQQSVSVPPTPESAADGDRKQSPDSIPGAPARVRENKLENKLIVQPAPTPSLSSPVPGAKADKKEPSIAQPAPTPGLPSAMPEAEAEKKEPSIARPAPTLSLPSPLPEAEAEKKTPSIAQPATTPGVPSSAPEAEPDKKELLIVPSAPTLSPPSPVPGSKPRKNRPPARAAKPPVPRNNTTTSGPLIIPKEQR
jgi:hypothetical protein